MCWIFLLFLCDCCISFVCFAFLYSHGICLCIGIQTHTHIYRQRVRIRTFDFIRISKKVFFILVDSLFSRYDRSLLCTYSLLLKKPLTVPWVRASVCMCCLCVSSRASFKCLWWDGDWTIRKIIIINPRKKWNVKKRKDKTKNWIEITVNDQVRVCVCVVVYKACDFNCKWNL